MTISPLSFKQLFFGFILWTRKEKRWEKSEPLIKPAVFFVWNTIAELLVLFLQVPVEHERGRKWGDDSRVDDKDENYPVPAGLERWIVQDNPWLFIDFLEPRVQKGRIVPKRQDLKERSRGSAAGAIPEIDSNAQLVRRKRSSSLSSKTYFSTRNTYSEGVLV